MFSSFIRTLTVGNGISPFQHLSVFADYTAGGESHPALKIFSLHLYYMQKKVDVNSDFHFPKMKKYWFWEVREKITSK